MKTATIIIIVLITIAIAISANAQQEIPSDYPNVPYKQPQFVRQCWYKTRPDRPQEWVQLTVVHDMPSYLWNRSYKWSRIQIAIAADLNGWESPIICPGQANSCFFDRYLDPHEYYYLDGYDSIILTVWEGSFRIPEAWASVNAEVRASGAWQIHPYTNEPMECFFTRRNDICIIPFMLYDSDGEPRGFNYPMNLPPDEDQHIEIDYDAVEPCPQVLNATPRSWMPILKNRSGV